MREQIDLVVGALDSLGVALASHGHEWTEGERVIYEESINDVIAMRGDTDTKGVLRIGVNLGKAAAKFEEVSKEEWSGLFRKQIDDMNGEIVRLEGELDAEREKVKPLVEALILVRKALCSGGGLREATDIIDDALAKAKEGK
jgi:hypothetical protein